MKKFNGLSKGFMGVATVACLLFAAGVTGVPYYGSVGGEAIAVAKKANKSNKADKAKKISADKAKKIALGDAKLAEKDVTFVKVELEFENSRLVYDVEFYSGNVEYDYDIDAVSGAIVSSDRDIENYSIPAQQTTVAPAADIGVEKAKEIALSHAGVGSARFTKAKIDYENGIKVYEIEFKVGNMEYEYDINVLNGAIVSSSAEIDD
ncbi:hypothetical protein HMPREF0491_01561 [Lachnospiraceae oral taxon 107 str. F0167]|nr:hypothetical protein HMPREF0491_01561 [Lachnospiraceae oral taxon 107 str. F0167]